jgi:diaminohydroxyphosphoribosylaminopyrimidine deaminase/5-amino-6-(5-phosphoribosylamino)uracil reductase
LNTASEALSPPRDAPATVWSALDQTAMTEARSLARLGAGRTWTNPMVGAVVVAEGGVVGVGYHRRLGDAHAESVALAAAGRRACGATLYVNLEPCAHHGRTSPCVEAIAAAGIRRVVMAAPDPDPRVSGTGAEWLRARGVVVDAGCHAVSAIIDNHGYYHDRLGFVRTVTLKMASARDGMVARAPGRRDRVTGDAAQEDAHRLRAVHDAVAIGAATARIDRPRLDCRRLPNGVDHEPVIVVFDTTASVANDAGWPARGREFVVVTGPAPEASRVRAIEARGGRVVRCALERGSVSVRDALDRLAGAGLHRILVEGGPRLVASFVGAQAWDAMWHYESPERFGPAGVAMMSDAARDAFERARTSAVDELTLGPDVRRRYANARSWQRLIGALGARVSPRGGVARVHGNR